jgi:coatomer subunit beta
LELATSGDLKLVERPQNYTLAPYTSKNIKAHIKVWWWWWWWWWWYPLLWSYDKVSSTETGVIFGSIVYDIAGSNNTEKSIILNEIRIDVIDYISPAYTDDITFRKLWSEVAWENKVVVRTSFEYAKSY